MKKNYKTLMIGAAALGTAAILGANQASASLGARGGEGCDGSEEKHEAMELVLENKDYQAWLELMGDRPVAQEINEDEFAKFIEMHELREAGDHEAAEVIAEELGLSEMRATHMGDGEGKREGHGKRGMYR